MMSTTGAAADRVLDALGDPTRRRVLALVRHEPRSVGDVAAELPVTRPAVSQHLKILKGAGLVTDRAEGTRRLYVADPTGLATLRTYVEAFGDDALAAFAGPADEEGDDR